MYVYVMQCDFQLYLFLIVQPECCQLLTRSVMILASIMRES